MNEDENHNGPLLNLIESQIIDFDLGSGDDLGITALVCGDHHASTHTASTEINVKETLAFINELNKRHFPESKSVLLSDFVVGFYTMLLNDKKAARIISVI